MELMFNRALVTGGAGFIGSHLVEVLVNGGCAVTVLDDLSTGRLSNLASVKKQVRFIEGDIAKKADLDAAVRDCEVIFHQAAVVSVTKTVEEPVSSSRVNDLGTLAVLDAARGHGVKRVVLASSCAVYGDSEKLPKIETMSPDPLSPYAVQKLTGEYWARLYHRLYGVQSTALRYFNVFGPRQDPSSPYSGVISIFLTKALSGEAPIIYGDGRQCRDFVFVKDVVAANISAASSPAAAGGVFNIGTGRAVTVNELWAAVRNISGCEIDPIRRSPRPGDVKASRADPRKAEAVLGFNAAVPFEEGLRRTLAYYEYEKGRAGQGREGKK